MINVAIYLFDKYFETEISIPAMLLAKENVFTIASDQEVVTCMDGRRMMVDRLVKDVKAQDIDVLIIPGGTLIPKDDISELIRNCEKEGAIIGGICAGVDYLAYAGILENRRYTSYYNEEDTCEFLPETGTLTGHLYESDRRVVSAKAEGYLEFALELYRLAGKLEEEDVPKLLEWFKSPNAFQVK